jgi:hypothetical protein
MPNLAAAVDAPLTIVPPILNVGRRPTEKL